MQRTERLYLDRQPLWQKLEFILDRIDKRGHAGLSRQELQELGGLYRCVAADLARSRAQTKAEQANSELPIYLNNLAVRAHNQIYKDDSGSWRQFFYFFGYGFPALVRKYILYVIVAFLAFLIPATLGYIHVQKDPIFADLEIIAEHPLVPDTVRSAVKEHKLWTKDKAKVSPLVSSFIITNNIRVTLAAFALGVTFGLGTLFILMVNGLHVGTILGVCNMQGMAGALLTFISGHGFLELSAIFISGGAGLLMGKSLLFPGRWRRLDALKLISRDAFALLAGCVPLLLIAGFIEGFISTQEDIAPDFKHAIGIFSFAALIFYLRNGSGRKI